MFVGEDKVLPRRLGTRAKFPASVLFIAFAIGAAFRLTSGGATDPHARNFCMLTGLGLWLILASSKALRAAVVGFLALIGA